MVENKYQIGVRRFGLINWIGFLSLWKKECQRFIIVWAQTLLSPLVSSLLFLSVLSFIYINSKFSRFSEHGTDLSARCVSLLKEKERKKKRRRFSRS